MPLSPYLAFSGNCADAIAYYQQALGAELRYKITFGEMPPSAMDDEGGCPSGLKFPDSAIAHASVHIAGSDIMMSDGTSPDAAGYSGFTLVLDTQDVKRVNAGSTISPPTARLKWPGRRPSGHTVLAASSTATACRG